MTARRATGSQQPTRHRRRYRSPAHGPTDPIGIAHDRHAQPSRRREPAAATVTADAADEPQKLKRSIGVVGGTLLTLSCLTPASSLFVIVPGSFAVLGTGTALALAIAMVHLYRRGLLLLRARHPDPQRRRRVRHGRQHPRQGHRLAGVHPGADRGPDRAADHRPGHRPVPRPDPACERRPGGRRGHAAGHRDGPARPARQRLDHRHLPLPGGHRLRPGRLPRLRPQQPLRLGHAAPAAPRRRRPPQRGHRRHDDRRAGHRALHHPGLLHRRLPGRGDGAPATAPCPAPCCGPWASAPPSS